ncbi:hypothetical protein CYMTET_47767 [Cymbomonas tetramitiformis]|uniref:E3 ubiquitin-protein ligase CHFR n=1 Tax=Cymbomonas tetramitiformis TaxID=36881 RepID=A0AAE0BTM5_9CHLO|nr:hypothetical protein CYMTET_47767 [Cymbomonas tetramitiformis]|eukprot:gene3243-4093_t
MPPRRSERVRSANSLRDNPGNVACQTGLRFFITTPTTSSDGAEEGNTSVEALGSVGRASSPDRQLPASKLAPTPSISKKTKSNPISRRPLSFARLVLSSTARYIGNDQSGPKIHLTLNLSEHYNKGTDWVCIGRHWINHIPLDDALGAPRLLSKQHAWIGYRFDVDGGKNLYMGDKESVNGTFLNEQRLRPSYRYQVNHGDTVSFGGPQYISRGGVRMKNPFHFVLITVPPPEPQKGPSIPHDTDVCAVCLEEPIMPMTAAHCKHIFCADCLSDCDLCKKTTNFELRCPTCRTPFMGATLNREWVRTVKQASGTRTEEFDKRVLKGLNFLNEADLEWFGRETKMTPEAMKSARLSRRAHHTRKSAQALL